MIIANPLYDVVFKRLMDNERVAKFFIGVLLGKTIDELEVVSQELPFVKASGELSKEERQKRFSALSSLRLDFIAHIKLENGDHQKVLIEIQKASRAIDIMRFRKYLGTQYTKTETINGKKTPLPIKTIYILGSNLPTIETACLHVERQYKDMLSGTILEETSMFIEGLTHDSYVIQVERIGGKYQTSLERLLSIFEQAHFLNDEKTIKDFPHKFEFEEEEIQLALGILEHTAADPERREEIEAEQEVWRTLNEMWDERENELYFKLKNTTKANKQLEIERKRLKEEKQLEAEARAKAEEEKKLAEEREKLEAEARAKAEEEKQLEAEARAKAEEEKQLEAKARAKAELKNQALLLFYAEKKTHEEIAEALHISIEEVRELLG